MSEYQYYEFQAVDHPLGEADRQALRDLSTRARITATSFTNSYEWGDFKGDPAKLMERWFDLHLYMANWGSRRLMIGLPARFIDAPPRPFLREVECVRLRSVGENLIFNITRDKVEFDGWDDGSGWLAPRRSAPTALGRPDFLSPVADGRRGRCNRRRPPEPMPGLGPLTGASKRSPISSASNRTSSAAAERSAGAMAQRNPSSEEAVSGDHFGDD